MTPTKTTIDLLREIERELKLFQKNIEELESILKTQELPARNLLQEQLESNKIEFSQQYAAYVLEKARRGIFFS